MSIQNYLQTKYNILEYECLASTNDTAKELALGGAKENTVIIADRQTSGRGRMNRTFFSPEHSGIYMSILLRPEFSAEDSVLITPAAAVAVSEAIDEICGVSTKIKWVNDIYIKNKKVCGILCESGFTNDGYFSILGIGINLYEPENSFPKEIENIAGAIYNTQPENEIREKLIAKVIDKFNFYYKNLLNKEFLKLYREKSNLIGKEVKYQKDGKEVFATVLGIDDNAHLIVKTKDSEEHLYAGEVSVRLK